MKKVFAIIICLFIVVFIGANHVFAEDASLQIYAVNAGYKDDSSAQNFDFIELLRTTDSDLPLGGYSLKYFNSSGNEAGEITFNDAQTLVAERLILGFSKSPQYADWADSPYLYYFSSSGLASTAGKVQLFFGDELIDEVCWGKLECTAQNPKFATKQSDNYSLVRSENGYLQQQYYPEIQPSILETIEEVEPLQCGVIITEIFTYYEESATEQFIELYNPTEIEQNISHCAFSYKNSPYVIDGNISPGTYFVYKNSDLVFTKNPTTYNLYTLSDTDVLLPHGQKKGTSYALFNMGTKDEQ